MAGPSAWFRLMPQFDSGKHFKVHDLRNAIQNPPETLMPLYWSGGARGHLRGEDGFGFYEQIPNRPHETWSTAFVFTTGEVWAVDSYLFQPMFGENTKSFYLPEDSFRNALTTYAALLQHLGLEPPYKWIAGIDGIKGKALQFFAQPGHMNEVRIGELCLSDYVCETGTYTPGDDPKESLRPFFESVYDKCGLPRPAWLNEKSK